MLSVFKNLMVIRGEILLIHPYANYNTGNLIALVYGVLKCFSSYSMLLGKPDCGFERVVSSKKNTKTRRDP